MPVVLYGLLERMFTGLVRGCTGTEVTSRSGVDTVQPVQYSVLSIRQDKFVIHRDGSNQPLSQHSGIRSSQYTMILTLRNVPGCLISGQYCGSLSTSTAIVIPRNLGHDQSRMLCK